MSGRGLGYTGGTIDKLESIPGYRVNLDEDEIMKQVYDIGLVVTGQTAELVPMDKIVYSLRDVTATVSSIPLIASSIMSKKIAGGADKILIDIKVGNGALLKTKEDAKKLSSLMIRIGEYYDREVRTIISDMNVPLGITIGNSLEVLEAIDVLRGKEKNNPFVDLCVELASNMVSMCLGITMEEAKEKVLKSISDQSAFHKFEEMVNYQKGDLKKIKVSNKTMFIKSPQNGVIEKISAIELGKLSLNLGAGKRSIQDTIDYSVGIKLNKLVGDKVKKGDVLATIYYKNKVPEIKIDNIYKFE